MDSRRDCQATANRSFKPVWRIGEHVPQLDGVRGLAILIVTLYRFSKEIPTDTFFSQSLHGFFSIGNRGVDLFFVLSGFLITGILVDAKGSPHAFGTFLARRSLRIFPLYFTAVALFVLFANNMPSFAGMFAQASENQFFLWTYLTNIKMAVEGEWCFGGLDHFWSLSVEEHFYLVWPLILLFGSTQTALRWAIALAVGGAGSRIVFAMFSDNGVAPDVFSFFRSDALLIGAIISLQIRTSDGLAAFKKWSYAVGPACLVAGITLELLDKRLFTVGHTVWPLLWGCCLVWLLTGNCTNLLSRFFGLAGLRNLGRFSYAMYVFQSPLIVLLAGVVSVQRFVQWSGDAIVGSLMYMVCMSVLSYGAALLSWYSLEQHFLKLKRFFPVSPEPARERQAVTATA